MIQLYWCPRTRSSRALWLMEESGLEFERVLVDIRSERGRDVPSFRDASPMGKVPALRDGETGVADSAAIALYVADRYPETGLAPALDAPNRGHYLYWMLYTPGVIEPAMSEKFNQVEPNRGRSGWGDFDLMIDTFDKGLDGNEWILGDKFTAADVMLGFTLGAAQSVGVLDDRLPNLQAYFGRLLARPALQRALAD